LNQALFKKGRVQQGAVAIEPRIPGVVDVLTGTTRGPSLLGAVPGEYGSPAKARQNQQQRQPALQKQQQQ